MPIRRPSDATAIACLALFVALGGPSEAAKTVGLRKDSVTSVAIKNRTITAADLSAKVIAQLRTPRANTVNGASVRDGSIGGADIAANSIGGDRLAPGSVGGDRLAANSVSAGQVVNNSLGTDDIADGAIDSQELKDGSVLGKDLAEGTVGSREVGALGAAEIAEYAGSLGPLDFGTIALGGCKSVTSTSLTPLRTGLTLLDDVVTVTPRSGFPSAGVAITAKASSENQIEVTICNVDGPANLNLGTETLRYLAIDTTVG